MNKSTYQVPRSEYHGLLVIATANGKSYKLYISEDLLNENGLQRWKWDITDYYKQFVDQNIDKMLAAVQTNYFRAIHDGYDVDIIPTM